MSAQSPPKMPNGYVDGPRSAWLAPPMTKRTPAAIAQYRPMTAFGAERIEDGVGLELGRALRVVVVREVADLDLRAAHERLQEDDAVLAGDGVQRARIGAHADEYPG